jgi:hypothetical protein
MFGEHDQIGIRIFQVFEGHAQGPIAIAALLGIVMILSLAFVLKSRRLK